MTAHPKEHTPQNKENPPAWCSGISSRLRKHTPRLQAHTPQVEGTHAGGCRNILAGCMKTRCRLQNYTPRGAGKTPCRVGRSPPCDRSKY